MLRKVTWPEGLANKGNLYLSSMPGRFEALEVFLREIEAAAVTHVLCLVSDKEIARKSPGYLAAIQRDDFPVALWRFEIPDYGMPENVDELDLMLDRHRERLDAGESTVIHCAAGHGRTGMVATLLLMRMGVPLRKAAEVVRLAGSGPDTPEQQEFLRSREQAALVRSCPPATS
jgi:protein-tyrosine phosphatase